VYAEKIIVTDYESWDSKILYYNVETSKLIKLIYNNLIQISYFNWILIIMFMQIYPVHITVVTEPKMW